MLAVIAGASQSTCSLDERQLEVASLNPDGLPPGGEGEPDAGASCEGSQAGQSGCLLPLGEACSTGSMCEGGRCVAAAAGGSVCCAIACSEAEVCTADGASCVPAQPCSESELRCSGALQQSCVDGVWQTLSDCGALGCTDPVAGCRRSAGQACESDANCGEGTCLATAEGSKVCCTGACGVSCQRCSAQGTECEDVPDDEACGPIECPTDPCRVFDPATVLTNRCSAGQCATAAELCTVSQPQRANLECSATALCDADGTCSLPKRPLLSDCSSDEQCVGGACVATADGASVCCSQPCAASEVCSPNGACVPAPVCGDGELQCSGSNFQRCVAGQWVTDRACGALGCSVQREGCFASAGEACSTNADCGQGTCQEAASGGSVCCTAVCGGPCRACGVSGTACANLQEDTACGIVPCSSFDSDCVTTGNNLVNACNGIGQCSTTANCGFRSNTTRCGQGGLCNGQGACEGPSVECGNQTCSASDACCSLLDFATGVRTVGCGVGGVCSFPGAGAGPSFVISCDQNADCVGNEVCCMVSNNVNSGLISCRLDCTAEAVGAELGAPPEMLVVGQLCASEEGPLLLACPAGQTCSPTVSTLPPEYSACR